MTKKAAIKTTAAPQAIGPYSQGIKAGSLLLVSGQLPISPDSGKLVAGDIQEKTKQVIANIKAIVEAAGGSLEDIVKTTIFLTDLSMFQAVNETYGKCFAADPPARSTIQVSALPLGSPIEIEALAVIS